MHSSAMDQLTLWHFDQDNSRQLNSSIWRVSCCIYTDMQLLLTGPSNSSVYVACYSNTDLCISTVLMLLLLVAGDVETNPGPTDRYDMYPYCLSVLNT